ncbi:unnamed protein product [Amoebophrya sp. A25]|nr:unnamed protein product [Amoebophrya sp. A25]|eukprot:GSA25T00012827001.1
MSVKIVDLDRERNALSLTPEGKIFFNQFRAQEKLKFISFIGAGRVGKSWLASRFAEHVWYDTVVPGCTSGAERAKERARIPVPWSGDIFFTRGQGEAVTKGIWAFALRPNDQVDEGSHDPENATSEQGSPKQDPNEPGPTIIILDCEGSDNLLDTHAENTVAKQIQAISFFLAGRGSVVFVETDRLRTQSLDDLARILDVKLDDDGALYDRQQLFVVVNKETLGSSHGLEQLLQKTGDQKRASCVTISNGFAPDRRHFFRIPTFFCRNNGSSPDLVTYSDMTLEEALDQLFAAIQKRTPVSNLQGSECARAVLGYLNMEALEEHLSEMVSSEVVDYKRDMLPVISRDTATGITTGDEQVIDDPVTSKDWRVTIDDELSLDFEQLCQITVPQLTQRLLLALDRRPTKLPTDAKEQVQYLKQLYYQKNISPRDVVGGDGVATNGTGANGTVANIGTGGATTGTTTTASGNALPCSSADHSKFDASVQVSISKFARKPYVRYATVRAPQIVEKYVALLEAELTLLFLREKHNQRLLETADSVLQTLVEMLVLQLESDTLEKLLASTSSASTGNSADDIDAAGASPESQSSSGTSTTAEGLSSNSSNAGGSAKASPVEMGDNSGTTANGGPLSEINSQKQKLVPTTEQDGGATPSSASSKGGARRLKSITGESVKVRSLLCYDDQILDRLLAEFDANPVVERILSENKSGDHFSRATIASSPSTPTEQSLVLSKRTELEHRLHRIYVSEVNQNLDKLVTILLERLNLPGGMFGFLQNASYDDDETQAILRDFENNHSVRSCTERLKSLSEGGGNSPNRRTTQTSQQASDAATTKEDGGTKGATTSSVGRKMQILMGMDPSSRDSTSSTSTTGNDKKSDLLKETVDRYRHKLRYAVQERIRMHNEKILTQLIGMFRC